MAIYDDGIPAKYDGFECGGPCVFCGVYKYGADSEGICFDCWYQIDWGVRAERERIIKLLENYAGKECGFGIEHDLVALIKGKHLEDEQNLALKAEIAELQNDLDRFGAEMDICTCELIEAEIERLTEQLKGEK